MITDELEKFLKEAAAHVAKILGDLVSSNILFTNLGKSSETRKVDYTCELFWLNTENYFLDK